MAEGALALLILEVIGGVILGIIMIGGLLAWWAKNTWGKGI